MTPIAFETALFAANEGTTAAQVIAAWEQSQSWASAQPGLLSRRLAQSDDGDWMDMVEWRDMAAAKAAQAAFSPDDPALAALMGVINMDTLRMMHHTRRA